MINSTNIFLDVILKRQPHYKYSSQVWSLISDKKINGYISAISINTINNLYQYYIVIYFFKGGIKNETWNCYLLK
jgi:predicted nucleic acid-binding protein